MRKRILAGFFASILAFLVLFTGKSDSRSFTEDEQLLLVGIGAFNDGFFDVAEKQFSQYLKSYPSQEKVHDVTYLLGKTFLMKGKWSEAKSLFSKIVNENRNAEYLDHTFFWLALTEMKVGNQEGARKSLQSLVKNFPKFEWQDRCYYLLALLDLSSSRPATATSSFKKVFLLSKNEELIQSSLFWLGILSIQQKQYETAIGYFQGIRQNAKSLPDPYAKDALFWQGEAQVRMGRFNDAKSNYATFYQRFKTDDLSPEVYWRLGYCQYRLGNLKESLELLRSYLNQSKDPRLYPYTCYLLGEILLAMGDPLSSIKELNSILNDPQGHALWGTSLLTLYWISVNSGQLEEANRILQRLLRSNQGSEEKIYAQWLTAEIAFFEGRIPDALPYYFNILNSRLRERALFQIGKGHFFENRFREAITNLDILILEFPGSQYSSEALFIKAESLFASGSSAPALETLDQLIGPNHPDPWQFLALTEVGRISLSLNESDKAMIAFRRVLDRTPDHPLSCYAALLLGDLYLIRTNLAEAARCYSFLLKGRFLELMGEAHFRMGEIFYQQGKYDKAFVSFEMAARQVKENSLCFFLTYLEIGNLEGRKGKWEDAKRCYRVVLNSARDEEVKKAARELLNRVETN